MKQLGALHKEHWKPFMTSLRTVDESWSHRQIYREPFATTSGALHENAGNPSGIHWEPFMALETVHEDIGNPS